MPAYNNPNPDEGFDDAAAPATEQESPSAEESEAGKGPVATIPKSLLAGKDFQPGEEIVFKIVSIQDDSVVIEYASEHGKEYGEDEHAEMGEGMEKGGAPMEGGDRYASMME